MQHFSGLEEAVFRNIAACKEFVNTIKTAYGPYGMNKIIINHIDKLFVTNDAATIVKELEVSKQISMVSCSVLIMSDWCEHLVKLILWM